MCSKERSRQCSGLQKANVVLSSYVRGLFRTVLSGGSVLLYGWLVIALFADYLKRMMFTLVSVRVCLAFMLLYQMVFQEFKAISTKVHQDDIQDSAHTQAYTHTYPDTLLC